jgi:hypothetical protein
VTKDGSFTDGSGSSQSQTGSRSEAVAKDKAKPNAEKGPEVVAVKQDKAQNEEREIATEAVASSQQQPN